MGPGSASPFTGFRLGPLTIDLDRGVVSGEQGASGLTPRAEDLLLLLSRRAGILVTREDILETVWSGRVVEDAAISHCVWQIRRVLGPAGKDILQTRPKRGYVLVVADSAWIRGFANAAEPSGAVPAEGIDESAPDSLSTPTASPADGVPLQGMPVTALHGTAKATSDAPDAPTPAAAVTDVRPSPGESGGARSGSRRRRRWRHALPVAAALVVAAGAGAYWWRATHRIELDPGVEMSAAVLAPASLDWLRQTLLRETIEQAYIRDVELVVFERAQTEHVFRGPHLEVRIDRADPRDLQADIALIQGDLRIHRRFRGPADDLPDALRALLAERLPAPTRTPGPAADAFVAGRLAETRFDRATAQLEYRRALGLDAGMTDARIALAGSLFEQGYSQEARETAAALSLANVDAVRRCRIERLLARVAPDALGEKRCPRAEMVARLERLQMRDALREAERLDAAPSGAGEWLEYEDGLILALMRLQDLDRARYEIDRARGIAERAGWTHAALRLQTNLGPLHMHRGERGAAAVAQRRLATAFAELGDLAAAAESRVWVQRAEPIVPGPAVAARRTELTAIADQARASGQLRAEVEALLLLARMDRDRPDRWSAHLQRARDRLREARLDGGNSLHPYFVVGEMVAARRYDEALAEIAVLQQTPQPHPRGPSWVLYLQVESHFWRGELDAAIASIDAMERAGLDLTASPNPCFFAWVLTEARRRERANAYLERCSSEKRSPEQTDFGLIAAVRQRVLDGQPERAWPMLLPRLDALLAIAEPSRQEAEALALIAREAASVPGADPARLRAAVSTTQRVAALDGAGPGLRAAAESLRRIACAPGAQRACAAPASSLARPSASSGRQRKTRTAALR